VDTGTAIYKSVIVICATPLLIGCLYVLGKVAEGIAEVSCNYLDQTRIPKDKARQLILMAEMMQSLSLSVIKDHNGSGWVHQLVHNPDGFGPIVLAEKSVKDSMFK
jgi:hypothetical protein